MLTPRLPAVNWTDATHRADLNGLGPFIPKDEIWFLRVCHHISAGLYLGCPDVLSLLEILSGEECE